jgi:hypothetical protein
MAIVTDWTLEQFLRLPETKPALEFECGRMSQADYAYLAGVIDGEGCIRIQRVRARGVVRYQLRLHVANTSRALMDWLEMTFGGHAYARKKPHGGVVWDWHVKNGHVPDVLRLVLPYLIVKREEALLAFEFRAAVRKPNDPRYLSLDQQSRQEDCWRRMGQLKYANSPSRKGHAYRASYE